MTENNFFSDHSYAGLYLFNESDTDLPVQKNDIETCCSFIEQEEECTFQLVEVVFTDQEGIIAINREHLERDYITDIISFRYDEDTSNKAIEGTLYCCANRIAEQAKEFSESPQREFRRIIIHGLLHLVGYHDQSKPDKKIMREKEDFFLNKLT